MILTNGLVVVYDADEWILMGMNFKKFCVYLKIPRFFINMSASNSCMLLPFQFLNYVGVNWISRELLGSFKGVPREVIRVYNASRKFCWLYCKIQGCFLLHTTVIVSSKKKRKDLIEFLTGTCNSMNVKLYLACLTYLDQLRKLG